MFDHNVVADRERRRFCHDNYCTLLDECSQNDKMTIFLVLFVRAVILLVPVSTRVWAVGKSVD